MNASSGGTKLVPPTAQPESVRPQISALKRDPSGWVSEADEFGAGTIWCQRPQRGLAAGVKWLEFQKIEGTTHSSCTRRNADRPATGRLWNVQ